MRFLTLTALSASLVALSALSAAANCTSVAEATTVKGSTGSFTYVNMPLDSEFPGENIEVAATANAQDKPAGCLIIDGKEYVVFDKGPGIGVTYAVKAKAS